MKMRMLLLAAMAAVAFPAAAADKIPVVEEEHLAEQWKIVPATQLMPPYPPAYASDPEEVCMVVGYLVNADGHTSDFALLKSWTSGENNRGRTQFWEEFGDLASRAVAQWKYVPAGAAPSRPAYTATTFVFGKPDAVMDTRAHCLVPDLSERLAELRYDARASRRMAGGVLGQLEIDPYIEERLRLRMMTQRENAARAGEEASNQEHRSVQAHPNDAD
ncbi:MAG: hypothetical protein ACTHOC_09980 [Luteimonas sp.]